MQQQTINGIVTGIKQRSVFVITEAYTVKFDSLEQMITETMKIFHTTSLKQKTPHKPENTHMSNTQSEVSL